MSREPQLGTGVVDRVDIATALVWPPFAVPFQTRRRESNYGLASAFRTHVISARLIRTVRREQRRAKAVMR